GAGQYGNTAVGQVMQGARGLLALAQDQYVVDRRVGGGEAEIIAAQGSDGQAGGGHIGLATVDQLVDLFDGIGAHQLQVDAKLLGKATGQLIVEAGIAVLVLVPGSGGNAGGDDQLATGL